MKRRPQKASIQKYQKYRFCTQDFLYIDKQKNFFVLIFKIYLYNSNNCYFLVFLVFLVFSIIRMGVEEVKAPGAGHLAHTKPKLKMVLWYF